MFSLVPKETHFQIHYEGKVEEFPFKVTRDVKSGGSSLEKITNSVHRSTDVQRTIRKIAPRL